ncbi:MAG: amino acid permease, partial [Candidatus Methylomirabilales bacterium]
ALTGVEAISNGVPVFRPPESKNAAATLLILGILLAGLFAGITFLANALHVDPGAIEHGKTVPSQIARAVFGGGSPLFFAVQAFTAMILFLAANTSYADFPRLAAILAKDRYLPRVLKHRGDKLAFSNGIVILALAASALLAHYRAEVHRIIPLYVIGVFTSFTLSQSGMVAHWFRLRAPGWRRSALVNGIGACTTFIVLIVVAATKFRLGAWQVVVMIPVLAWILGVVGRHYRQVAEELRLSDEVERIEANKVVILGSPFPAATTKALAFARAFSPRELHVLAFRLSERSLKGTRQHWKALGVKAPIEATGPRLGDLVEYVRGLQPSASEPVMVALPDAQFHNPLRQIRAGRLLIRIKRAFFSEPGVVVTSVPFAPGNEPEPDRLVAPARLAVIVLVSAVHRATIRALEYARSLYPAELKALTIAADPEDGQRLLAAWEEWGIHIPLEVVNSPYRSLIQPLLSEVRALSPNPRDAVAVVVPEFVVPRRWQRLLHNQTAFLIKAALFFEPNVIVIDVPFPLRLGRRKGQINQRAIP